MKSATEEAKKMAEMVEAAKKAVEGKLRRWREREQKKAADAASRILAETETSVESSPRKNQSSLSLRKEAKKMAEMVEAAKKAVEGELRRWREREQKKAADAASRVLAETETSVESYPRFPSGFLGKEKRLGGRGGYQGRGRVSVGEGWRG